MDAKQVAQKGKIGLRNLERLLKARNKLPKDVLVETRAGKPIPKAEVVARLSVGNKLFLEAMKKAEVSKLVERMVAVGLCCDARPTKLGMSTMLGGIGTKQAHVAANVVESAIFKRLTNGSFSAMIGHGPACGGVEAVCGWLNGTEEKGHRMLELFSKVPKGILQEKDSKERSIRNAVHQSHRMIEETNSNISAAGLIGLTPDQKGEYLDCRLNFDNASHSEIARILSYEAKFTMDKAGEEGIDPNPHSAMIALVYDPMDVGPISPTLAMLAMLPREVFTVTELTPSGLASLEYAISHGGSGHVGGIGGENGSGLVGVVASCRSKSDKMIDSILEDKNLRRATKNGETILKINYKPSTSEVNFPV
jgi:hypothetical protein